MHKLCGLQEGEERQEEEEMESEEEVQESCPELSSSPWSELFSVSKNISGCHFTSNVSWLHNDKSNLCVLAYNHMKDLYDIEGIDIMLTKNISKGSGLGSGSSIAAAVLKSINKIYDLI